MKKVLEKLFQKEELTRDEAKNILIKIGRNNFSEIEIASFLTVYLMREITPTELAGFRDALLVLCIPVNLSGFNTIDVCGTGGDGKNTFNISTISSFVLAGAGFKVAKHGNYGVSSPVGSSDILQYFGYRFSNNNEKLQNEVESAGITYLHAPLFHPAMKYVAPVRRALKMQTFFNMLGPIINPATPKYQLTGVYSEKVQNLYGEVLGQAGSRFMIIHSKDGYDEISLTGSVRVVSEAGEDTITPETFGFQPVQSEKLFGGDTIDEAAQIFTGVLENHSTLEQKQVVLANSAAAIRCINPQYSWQEGVSLAAESLESGRALKSFKKLISLQ